MYILKNAWLSITRNKGRNVLIGIIILLIACVSTIALAITNTSTNLIESYENSITKTATISFDRGGMKDRFDMGNQDAREDAKKEFSNMSSLTVEDIKNYSTAEHIEGYNYTYTISLDGDSLTAVDKTEEQNFPSPGGKMGGNHLNNSKDFSLTGYSDISSMEEFIEGKYSIKDLKEDAWDILFEGNYCLINEDLATENDIEVGDAINLKSDNKFYTLEVVGIYEEKDEGDENPMSMFASSANTIITNTDTLVKIAADNDDVQGQVNATFLIDSYDNLETIQDEFYEKGLSTNYHLTSNEEIATSSVLSIKNVLTFAQTFLVLTLILGLVILFVINLINIRERKYEIGVLRTIGMSKFKLTLKFLYEMTIVAVVALLLGAGLGSVCSKPVSNSLLANEIKESQENTANLKNNFGGDMGNMADRFNGKNNMIQGKPTIQAYDSIDAIVNAKVIMELLAIGILLIIVSSTAALVSIQRFSPLTILKERS